MDRLVDALQADRPVLNKTGLTGRYDITLFATPDFKLRDSSESGDISVLDAIKQFGLRLVPEKSQMEVLVVDHLDMPGAN